MKKCFISDHTHVWTDELKPVAEYLKVLELYEKTKYNVTYQTIRDNGKLLEGNYIESVATAMRRKIILYRGAKETIDILKENGFKVIAVTDNALLSLKENQEVIREKGLDFDSFYTTFIPGFNIHSSEGLSIKKYNGKMKFNEHKPDIIRKIIKEEKPELLIGMMQGKNDELAAQTIKEHNGYVISVSENSPLKEFADYHIDSLEGAKEIIELILENFKK
jgi:hypothetical protein